MFDALTRELLDLRVAERGTAPAGNALTAFLLCCSLVISLCSSSSSSKPQQPS